jgi:hypothetical protein
MSTANCPSSTSTSTSKLGHKMYRENNVPTPATCRCLQGKAFCHEHPAPHPGALLKESITAVTAQLNINMRQTELQSKWRTIKVS